MTHKTENTVLAEAWQRIHGGDAPAMEHPHLRKCPSCGRTMLITEVRRSEVSEETELRKQLAGVTAERDALVDEIEWAISELDADPSPRGIATVVNSLRLYIPSV